MEAVSGKKPNMVWHGDSELPASDLIVLPGGFSYGDYLRSGAMAARSPVMREIIDKAKTGTPVIGICNGFQILTEAGLLPGALLRNAGLNFVCRTVTLRTQNNSSMFTKGLEQNQYLDFPVAHHDGNYFADDETLDRLESEDRVAFRYVDNPNGSQRDIAGILNENGNVLVMMPHPERVISPLLGGMGGVRFFERVINNLK
jgi:phosphoribosylformylglycinamidine synthase I